MDDYEIESMEIEYAIESAREAKFGDGSDFEWLFVPVPAEVAA